MCRRREREEGEVDREESCESGNDEEVRGRAEERVDE